MPKTAGTTLHSLIERNYPCKQIYSARRPAISVADRILRLDERRLNELSIVKGHFPYGVHEVLPGYWEYFTFLRNPLKRVVSDYNFVLTQPGSGDYQLINGGKVPIDKAVKGNYLLDNLQTRFLLGGRYLDRSNRVEITKADGDLALTRLKRFWFIGLQEKFDAGVGILATKLGWSRLMYIRRNPSSAKMSVIPVNLKDAINEREVYDWALYRYAREFFSSIERESQVFRSRPDDVGCTSSKYTAMQTYYRYLLCRLIWLIKGDRSL